MKKLFKELYDRFYTPPELPVQEQEVEESHHPPLRCQRKQDRLVLQIVDAKGRFVEDTSIDSFISRPLSEPNGQGAASFIEMLGINCK